MKFRRNYSSIRNLVQWMCTASVGLHGGCKECSGRFTAYLSVYCRVMCVCLCVCVSQRLQPIQIPISKVISYKKMTSWVWVLGQNRFFTQNTPQEWRVTLTVKPVLCPAPLNGINQGITGLRPWSGAPWQSVLKEAEVSIFHEIQPDILTPSLLQYLSR